MDDMMKNLTDAARRVALTPDEKSAGREMLRSYMALTPMVARVEAPSRIARLRDLLSRQTMLKSGAVFGLTLATMVSAAGVSYAAEGSVPGDALYPVKIGINEQVQTAFATSDEAKAQWAAERAERRLAEAETLAQRGELKAEVRTDLDKRFREHADEAKARIAAFRDESNADAAADVAAHLEGTLRAHSQILTAIESDDSKDDDHEDVTKLSASVDEETASTVEERDKTENTVGDDAEGKAKDAATNRRAAAVNKIAEVRAYVAAKGAGIDAQSAAQVQARLAGAEAVVADGDKALAAGDAKTAFGLFSKAQRMAQEAKLLVRAKHDLKVNVKIDAGADIDAGKDDADEAKDATGADRGDAHEGDKTDGAGATTGRTGDGSSDDGASKDGKWQRQDDAEKQDGGVRLDLQLQNRWHARF